MLKLLTKPYPFLFSLKRNSIVAIIVGIFIAFLNILMIDEDSTHQYFKLSKTQISYFTGLITFFSIILIFEFFLKVFFSDTQKENWTIAKELGLISFLLFVITICNYIFLIFILKDTTTFLSIGFFLNTAFSVIIIGLVPASVIVWVNYTIILKENLKHTQLHNKKLKELLKNQEKSDQKEIVNISSDNKNEIIHFDLKQLLFIRSDGNYIEVYIKEKERVVKMLFRASIKTIENYLNKFSYIVRTHRSYLVNIQNIKSTKGNVRNYQLYFDRTEISVPVARSRFHEFNEAFKI